MTACSRKFAAFRLAALISTGLCFQFAAGAENNSLEQIIVTAQKVEQNILEVPVSVSVVRGEMVEELGATNITDLDGIAPNVILKSVALMDNGGKFAIRGIGFFDIDPLTDQKVQIMVDGVPHARNSGVIYDQVDIERVEILRGPQGTLFGRGSLAGTVNYVSRSAADEAGVSARFSAGEYGTLKTVLTVETGPLFDGALRGRLTTSNRLSDGYLKNAFNGRTLGELDTGNVRLRMDHEGRLANTSISFYEVDEDIFGVGLTNQIQDPYGVSDGDVNLVNIDQNGFRNTSERGFTVLSDIPLESGYLALLANKHESEFLLYADLDARVGLVPPAPSGILNVPTNLGFDIDQEQESLEIRYHREEEGDWDLVTGLYLFRENADRVFHTNIGPPASETLDFEDSFETAYARQETNSFAAFGQARFHLNESVALLVGGRMTNEEKSADLRNNPLPPPAPLTPRTRLTPSAEWNQPTWKLGTEYRPNDSTMIFATVSTGYKPGGFNGRATLLENAGPYDPEHSTSLEIGVKGSLLAGQLRYAATGFTTDYTGIVGLVRRPAITGQSIEAVNDNLGDMRISGFELESSWLAATNLVFDFAIGFLNGGWENYSADLNGDGIETDNSHFDILMAPELSTYGAMTYTQEFSSNTLRYRLDVRYQSRYTTNGRENFDYYYRPATAKLNGSVTWTWGENGDSLAIYGRNLTDNQPLVQAIVGIFPVMKFDPPRMLGVELKLNF